MRILVLVMNFFHGVVEKCGFELIYTNAPDPFFKTVHSGMPHQHNLGDAGTSPSPQHQNLGEAGRRPSPQEQGLGEAGREDPAPSTKT